MQNEIKQLYVAKNALIVLYGKFINMWPSTILTVKISIYAHQQLYKEHLYIHTVIQWAIYMAVVHCITPAENLAVLVKTADLCKVTLNYLDKSHK